MVAGGAKGARQRQTCGCPLVRSGDAEPGGADQPDENGGVPAGVPVPRERRQRAIAPIARNRTSIIARSIPCRATSCTQRARARCNQQVCSVFVGHLAMEHRLDHGRARYQVRRRISSTAGAWWRLRLSRKPEKSSRWVFDQVAGDNRASNWRPRSKFCTSPCHLDSRVLAGRPPPGSLRSTR